MFPRVRIAMTQRLYSTKTRIKTVYKILLMQKDFYKLRDYIPLKQGLRPLRTRMPGNKVRLRDYIPLKQGLRPYIFLNTNWFHIKLRDYIPLKQGLRRRSHDLSTYSVKTLRDYIPLKQGLRLPVFRLTVGSFYLSETIFH